MVCVCVNPDIGFHLARVGWMSAGRKSGVTGEGEENVVCNLSKLRLGFGLIRRTLSLLSGLEFPWCNFHIVLGKALQ